MIQTVLSFDGFLLVFVMVLTSIIGYAFKKINDNSKSLKEAVSSFEKQISEINAENAIAKTDREWIKSSLNKIEQSLIRIQNHLELKGEEKDGR